MAACNTIRFVRDNAVWLASNRLLRNNKARLSEFSETKELLGNGYLSKPVNGIVIGMSAGDVSKCVVTWKSSTSDQYIDLPMSTRKLNNLFHPTYAGSRDMKSTPCNARTTGTPCNAHTAGTLHTRARDKGTYTH